MAATSGISDVTAGGRVALSVLNSLLPASGAVPIMTITAPINMRLLTSASSNTVPGAECVDTHYVLLPVSWNTATQTPGTGSAAGFESKTNSAAVTYFGGTGAAAAQTITTVSFTSSDGTPVQVMYENVAVSISVPQGNQLSFPITTGIVNQIG